MKNYHFLITRQAQKKPVPGHRNELFIHYFIHYLGQILTNLGNSNPRNTRREDWRISPDGFPNPGLPKFESWWGHQVFQRLRRVRSSPEPFFFLATQLATHIAPRRVAGYFRRHAQQPVTIPERPCPHFLGPACYTTRRPFI